MANRSGMGFVDFARNSVGLTPRLGIQERRSFLIGQMRYERLREAWTLARLSAASIDRNVSCGLGSGKLERLPRSNPDRD